MENVSFSQFVDLVSLPKFSQFFTTSKRGIRRQRIDNFHLRPQSLNIILFWFSEFLQQHIPRKGFIGLINSLKSNKSIYKPFVLRELFQSLQFLNSFRIILKQHSIYYIGNPIFFIFNIILHNSLTAEFIFCLFYEFINKTIKFNLFVLEEIILVINIHVFYVLYH